VAKTKIEQLAVKAALRIVPLDQLQTDPSYQRDVGDKHRLIIADYDPEALGIPLVGQRGDGSLWIVDGLQRVTALRKMGRHKHLRAEVFPSRGPDHEAHVFRLVNANRAKLSSGALFRARLTEGDVAAWEIQETVTKAGFRLALGKSGKATTAARELTCVNALIAIHHRHGVAAIAVALDIVNRAWGDSSDRNAVNSFIITGLADFCATQDFVVDVDRLVPRLQTSTPAKILYSAGLGNWAKAEGVCNEIARLYRKRLNKRA
jgi:hypothetical protein